MEKVERKRFLDKPCLDCGGPIGFKGWQAVLCDTCSKIRKNIQTRNAKRVDRSKPEYKEQYRAYMLQRNYRITVEEHEALFESQGRKCAICRTDEPGGNKGWHTDHNHNTDKVRGILCHKCNLMIGLANDNVGTLLVAILYLQGETESDGKIGKSD